jgi:hypothetical protein
MRELIQADVLNSTAFKVAADIRLNPGLVNSFPWLSGVANSFEKYRFTKLIYLWISSCATTEAGRVQMVPSYNVQNDAPNTKVEAAQFAGTSEDNPWKDCSMRWDIKRLNSDMPWRYVRSTEIAADKKTYDAGELFLTVSGSAGTGTLSLGDLWCEYELELTMPAKPGSVASPHIPRDSTLLLNSAATQTIPLPAGTGAAALNMIPAIIDDTGGKAHDGFGIGLQNAAGAGFTLPAGTYEFRVGASIGLPIASTDLNSNISIHKNGSQVEGIYSTSTSPGSAHATGSYYTISNNDIFATLVSTGTEIFQIVCGASTPGSGAGTNAFAIANTCFALISLLI